MVLHILETLHLERSLLIMKARLAGLPAPLNLVRRGRPGRHLYPLLGLEQLDLTGGHLGGVALRRLPIINQARGYRRIPHVHKITRTNHARVGHAPLTVVEDQARELLIAQDLFLVVKAGHTGGLEALAAAERAAAVAADVTLDEQGRVALLARTRRGGVVSALHGRVDGRVLLLEDGDGRGVRLVLLIE